MKQKQMFVNAVQTWRKYVLWMRSTHFDFPGQHKQKHSLTPWRKAVSFILSFQLFLFFVKSSPSCLKIVENTIWKWRRRWWNLRTGGRNVLAAQVLELEQSSSAPLTLFFPPLPSSSLLWLWWMHKYFLALPNMRDQVLIIMQGEVRIKRGDELECCFTM